MDGPGEAGAPPDPAQTPPGEMLAKARELFQLCDKEARGFITKLDMQRLQGELPLSPDQLESVFHSLDRAGLGYLTPDDFGLGLGKFVGMELSQGASGSPQLRQGEEETFESGWSEELEQEEEEEEEEEEEKKERKRFSATMEQLGATGVLEKQQEVRSLWMRLRREKPELLARFEEVLLFVSAHLRELSHDRDSMEQALRRRESDHEREVQCLYEEMEQQIRAERDRFQNQDASHQDRSAALQRVLHSKEQELETLGQQQGKLEQELRELSRRQAAAQVDNARLQRQNQELRAELERNRAELDQNRDQLDATRDQLRSLQQEARLENEQRHRDVVMVSKNMQKERQSLLRQLELLRELNKTLRDEQDVFETKRLMNLRKRGLAPQFRPAPCCCCCHQDPNLLAGGH
ncbi:EF-hand calcium-binding domain-containing protein 4A [Tachyglossus aculeatus]|uniref:EF-hand calcium-binding domain-containing protein 4A n=1 Tax=Tachyglossus aculeatus TaxID=9261 RepID=UPI0018F75BFB|nr:EF-hand calcium-binding domain-containing protein 4A [Tachyglossus aculeatus]XP_038620227.1 EF-hand calcium-binding domain-containing protein 4A [Tachyglossus aculeatus]